jgi:uracil-DNA glycosylase family 4
MGFFSDSLFVTEQPKPTREQCGACGLLGGCQSPKMPVQGNGERGVMVIGDVPDIAGDSSGRAWGGSTGQYLRELVRSIGWAWERDLWTTSALACLGSPSGDRARYCRPLLLNRIRELQPHTIILMGQYALQAVVGESFGSEELGMVSEWVNITFPSREPLAWITSLYNPAQLDTKNGMRKKFWEHNFIQALRDSEKRASEGRHWPVLRDYNTHVDVVRDPSEAASIIRDIVATSRASAFDYETDRLKPDHTESQIVSCSICTEGGYTIAFPWVGEAITAAGEYLRSPAPKAASNSKFEDRWTLAHFGHPVRNLAWCTMNSAHIIDYRPGYCSIKTQAYLYLGWPLYDKHIHQFFDTGAGPNEPNDIHKIDIDQLLRYNGIDSAVEYDVAVAQMRYLQHPLLREFDV